MIALLASALILIPLLAAALQQVARELPSFDEYRVDDSYQGPAAAFNAASSKLARAYRTRWGKVPRRGRISLVISHWCPGVAEVHVRNGRSLMPARAEPLIGWLEARREPSFIPTVDCSSLTLQNWCAKCSRARLRSTAPFAERPKPTSGLAQPGDRSLEPT